MVRVLLLLVLLILVARVFWRVVDSIIEGATGRPPGSSHPQRSGLMVRDPVCGTFVLPERALSLPERDGRVYFCSESCREKYRAGGGRSGAHRAAGRTA
jgi:YHS domain-containing protein